MHLFLSFPKKYQITGAQKKSFMFFRLRAIRSTEQKNKKENIHCMGHAANDDLHLIGPISILQMDGRISVLHPAGAFTNLLIFIFFFKLCITIMLLVKRLVSSRLLYHKEENAFPSVLKLQ